MKILVFTTLFPNSVQNNHGIFVEKRLLELINRHDIEARVVAPVPWYPRWLARKRDLPDYHRIPKSETRSGIEVLHPRYPVIPGLSWRIAPIFLYLWTRAAVDRLYEQFAFDLVDAHFAFPDGVAASMLADRFNLPCLITARGSDINDSPNFFLPRRFLIYAFESVTGIIAVSNRLKERIQALGGPDNLVTVLPNGVDTDVFRPLTTVSVSQKYNVTKPYILSVGSLRELKGHHLIIEALASREDLNKYSLLIAGTGTLKAALQAQINRLNIGGRVKLIGEIPNAELPELYSGASALVLASNNEGCPNVVLEALACDTPVVACDVGAVPDLLPKSLQPFMITNRTANEIGRQISACLAVNHREFSLRSHAQALDWGSTCDQLSTLMHASVREK